ncbi:cytochrome P450 [Actinophytocola oryzae]|uniref:Cytochrome P450 n=1 Tax=Actinophytocola oryzae TaxID=502181 RepID=A0A4R7VW97_9PSEU|nr:cytochrome P450 [Actinophytocola oryzae]TDV53918.1 cytochrome P450 [Actinophytocola oryzae]
MSTLTELDADPHAAYARLRAGAPVSFLPETGQWLVTGWRDAMTVLSDPARFANDHADLREVFRQAYEPGLMPDEVDTVTRPIARKAADDMFATGWAELTSEYFEPVAAVAGATMLGLGLSCAETLLRWGTTLADDPDADTSAEAEAIVERLRCRPAGSLVARLVHADTDPVPLLKTLAVSVLEPGWLAAWTLTALWTDPEQLAAVRANRPLLGAAVYEALRWGGLIGVLDRRTTCPVSLGGADLPAGASLAVAVASANRDESVFAGADRFDVSRKVRPHLGFGVGPHHCPAYSMVIALARTALDELFARMPDLRPSPGWRPAPHGWRLRLPGPLDVLWTRQRVS